MSEAMAREALSPVNPEAADLSSTPTSPAEGTAVIKAADVSIPFELEPDFVSALASGTDVVVRFPGGPVRAAYGRAIVDWLETGAGKAHEPAVLVLVPTRELAQQIAVSVRGLGASKSLRVQAVYGGAPVGRQAVSLKAGTDVLVGTPGRLLDHIRRRNLSLTGLKLLVIDDADEVVAMGFWEHAAELLAAAPAERQVVLVTAGMPQAVAKTVATDLRSPRRVEREVSQSSIEGVTHSYYALNESVSKTGLLANILEIEKPESAVVFCNSPAEVESLAEFLSQAGLAPEAVVGNPRHRERERIIERIRSHELRLLVTSDGSVRQIDLGDISRVFNYSLPDFAEVYAYRVGRLVRPGKTFEAVSFVDPGATESVSKLSESLAFRFVEKSLPVEQDVARARSERIMKELAEKASTAEVGQHLSVAQELVASPEASHIVAFLLQSYFGAQAVETERRTPPPVNGARQLQLQRPIRGAAPDAVGPESDDARGRGRRRRRRGRRGERGSEQGYETAAPGEALGGEAEGDANVSPLETYSDTSTSTGSGSGSVTAVGAPSEVVEAGTDGMTRIRVNIGFDDGFKGRGSVAKRISALAGLTEGSVTEVESRREYSILKAPPHIAELVVDRVDGTPIGKKILTVSLAS